MNMSTMLTRIKLKLGLMNIASPMENLDETIIWVIQNVSLPVFSTYHPYKQSITINTNDLERLDKGGTYEAYLLPEFKNMKLLYVFDVRYDETCLSGLGYYGGGFPLLGGSTINQAMLANAGAGLASYMIPKMTFKWDPPRKLYVYNAYSSTKVVIDMGFEHDKSLATIEDSAFESFFKLALLDVKENLYPTYKQYTDLQTAYGNINIKIDDWADAENERKELINQWDGVFMLDNQTLYYI